jgi:hypothetical protein
MVPSEYYSGNNNLLSLYNKVATLVRMPQIRHLYVGFLR